MTTARDARLADGAVGDLNEQQFNRISDDASVPFFFLPIRLPGHSDGGQVLMDPGTA